LYYPDLKAAVEIDWKFNRFRVSVSRMALSPWSASEGSADWICWLRMHLPTWVRANKLRLQHLDACQFIPMGEGVAMVGYVLPVQINPDGFYGLAGDLIW